MRDSVLTTEIFGIIIFIIEQKLLIYCFAQQIYQTLNVLMNLLPCT